MSTPGQLTLSQKFHIQALKDEIKSASREALERTVVDLVSQMYCKNNLVKHLLSRDVQGLEPEIGLE